MLPTRNDPKWAKLLDEPESFTFSFLALRILMQRVKMRNVKTLPVAERRALLEEVVAFFEKNQSLMGEDIQIIFG